MPNSWPRRSRARSGSPEPPPYLNDMADDLTVRTDHPPGPRLIRAASEAAGVDEALIEKLVHAFYARIRADAVLGPIFTARVADWDRHLAQMCAFWSSVMLQTGRYFGRPMPAHVQLPVDAAHFDHWLDLFEQTAHQVCGPEAGALFVARARPIAASLEMGVAAFNQALPGPDRRYRRS